MAKTIGSLKCIGLNCGKEVAVGETSGGNLTLRCGFCGLSPYAPPGSKAAREIRAAMTPMDDAGHQPAPAPAAGATSEERPPAAKPASKVPMSAFNLAQL